MNCQAAGESLSGWIDGQLPAEEVLALEAHLSVCAECRSLADGLRIQDAELRRAFQPQRQAAQEVASRVLRALDQESQPVAPANPLSRLGWLPLILAVAAGFLLAVILFQPWRRQPIAQQPGEVVEAIPAASPVAHLVVATGDVEMRAAPAMDWQAFPAIKSFTCPSGSDVRTGDDVRCELKTTGGCVIRLNHDTEISLASPTSVIIRRGQIWCSSPENVSLKIVAHEAAARTPDQAAPPEPAAPPSWSYACPSSSCLLTADQLGALQVMTAAGETELHTPHGSERLGPGEQAQIVSGKIVKSREPPDPLLAAGWMHSLLACKGSSDAELTSRVNALLAQVGRSKVAWLYEQEIRGLGDCAVLPLVRYVQSPQSQGEPERRLTAMRLVGDLASSGTVPDLIGLLADDDAQTRFLAATALLRLTGLDQGRPPSQWREAPEECAPNLQRWREWLMDRRPPGAPSADDPISCGHDRSVSASAAIAGREIFLRGEKCLYCLANSR